MAISHPSCRSLDRISNLPTEVVDEIFKKMSIADAVRTSMLSTDWRYKWMSMSQLVFDDRCFPDSTDLRQNDSHLVNIVNNVLFLHNGVVSKFELNNFLQQGSSDVDRWILVLSRKNLMHLTLKFSWGDAYQVPASLFSCQSLRTLILEGCKLSSQIQFKGLTNLTRLELFDVNLTDEMFKNLLGNTPSLRYLKVIECKPLAQYNINVLNLSELVVRGLCHSFHISNTQKLGFLGIRLRDPNDGSACKLDKVLEGLNTLRHIIMWHPILEFMSLDTAPKYLGATYHNLKCPSIYVDYEDLKQVVAIFCLCRSSPSLETLNITAIWKGQPVIVDSEGQISETQVQKEGGVFCHLKTVRLEGFKGVQNEVGFVKFILLNAVVLQTIRITWDTNLYVDKKLLLVMEKLMGCKRASSEAEVTFSGLT
ncbi:hypothetical protein ACHQM5_023335 [Ranunculus cassubicifolius]